MVAQTVKNPPANAGDLGSSPGSGRSPGGGNGNPLQYSCLGNPMDRGAWRATVHGVVGLDRTKQLTLVNNILLVKLTKQQKERKHSVAAMFVFL